MEWRNGQDVVAAVDVPGVGLSGVVAAGTAGVIQRYSALTGRYTVRFDPERGGRKARVREVKADMLAAPARKGMFG
jgi:hypothetical protein